MFSQILADEKVQEIKW